LSLVVLRVAVEQGQVRVAVVAVQVVIAVLLLVSQLVVVEL
jgi:hypothetical protein